ncbi:MAG: hypothetical protein OQK69_01640 [Gammaproteobacteria bacterium]|nr:hypothetical protein [Gammaproteobacteria bacterium]
MSDEEKKPKKIKSVRDVIIESIECEPGIEGCTGDPDTCPNEPNRCDKKLSMFGYYDDTIKDSVEHVLSESLNELTQTFTASTRRWQMIVFPAMFAFILLATYGFFLIYSLTKDVGSIATQMGSINNTMQAVVVNMERQTMSIQEMNGHVRNMTVSMGKMSHDMAVINNSVSRPMQFMNSFTPW